MLHEIKNKMDGKVIFTAETETFQGCVELAVKSGISLKWADLQETDLRGADLQRADLKWADLQDADLQRADLRGADIDFASWPLWCGSKGVRVDERLAKQLLAHAFNAAKEFIKPTEDQKTFINDFHRIKTRDFPKF